MADLPTPVVEEEEEPEEPQVPTMTMKEEGEMFKKMEEIMAKIPQPEHRYFRENYEGRMTDKQQALVTPVMKAIVTDKCGEINTNFENCMDYTRGSRRKKLQNCKE